ncbi:response regulator [Acanthopleuribacter pedis]|uniref:Response regulator n=1 Tax=Acanthopleuribacter pedis TaxID=442870 RepID=A0A8J7U798_9BACT|nr:response regulator [Acanthopleuribacter pedis]MBO1322769.1 response regulator [Acanthopleuribacter pedis]
MRRILVLEDEFFLLDSMTRYLRGMADVRVYGYSTLKAACQGLRDHPPDLVFSDIRLPDGSGLGLIKEMQQLGTAAPLVFISAYSADHRHAIPNSGNITVLEKPVSLKKLRDLAEQKLRRPDESGEFQFDLSDYLQIAAMGRHSVRISCGDYGAIVILEGQPWHAEDTAGQGTPAFNRIVANWETHKQEVPVICSQQDVGTAGPQTLIGTLDGLLLDALRAFDEAGRDAETPAEPALADAGDFDRCYECGVEAMLDRDYVVAHKAFAAAAKMQPNNGLVRANLERLGVLIEQQAG